MNLYIFLVQDQKWGTGAASVIAESEKDAKALLREENERCQDDGTSMTWTLTNTLRLVEEHVARVLFRKAHSG